MSHILESIIQIEEYCHEMDESYFHEDKKTQDAVIRRIEIIGEASKNLSHKLKEKYPQIPWKKMAGMRDVLIHAYFGVDIEKTWNVVINDIPLLKKQIQEVLLSLKAESK